MKCIGVSGVVVEVMWGQVESLGPRQYNWSAHRRLLRMLDDIGLRARVHFCFHASGSISLPPWVLEDGARNPDLFFADRGYVRHLDCLSFGIDERACLPAACAMLVGGAGHICSLHAAAYTRIAGKWCAVPLLRGRTALQCYRDVMCSFRDAFGAQMGPAALIRDVVVGAPPCSTHCTHCCTTFTSRMRGPTCRVARPRTPSASCVQV